MKNITQKPVTLRAIMELLQSTPDDAAYLDAPLSIRVSDGHLHSEHVGLTNLNWSDLPRFNYGEGLGGSGIALNCYLSDHRLVKNRTA